MKNRCNRRVAITGLGILSPAGIGNEIFWDSIKNGRSEIKPITSFNAETFPVKIAGEIREFDPQFYSQKNLLAV